MIYNAAGDLQAAIGAFEDGNYLLAAVYGASSVAGFYSAYKTAGQTCFTGDTLVAVEDGQKRIDEIEVGDKVWAYNVETGETELKTNSQSTHRHLCADCELVSVSFLGA